MTSEKESVASGAGVVAAATRFNSLISSAASSLAFLALEASSAMLLSDFQVYTRW